MMANYLIVDDEPLIRKGVGALVTRIAPHWTLCGEAWNGIEGIEMALKYRPDLILADIRMPEMDGLTMSKKLINKAISIPIVFLTGHDEFEYVQQAIKNNAFDFLLKPIQENELIKLFNRYELEYGTKNQLKQNEMAILEQYEFFIMNALETGDKQGIQNIGHWYHDLKDYINIRSFIEITIRIINSYLMKHNIISSGFKLIINESNITNVIQELQAYCLFQVNEVKSNSKNELIIRVKEWTKKNIQKNPSLTDAAEYIYLSPTYFSEYFKRHTGETYNQFVIRCKVKHAKNLLKDNSLRIYEIAEKVGYIDHRYFSKVFLDHTGMTPTEYRKKIIGTT